MIDTTDFRFLSREKDRHGNDRVYVRRGGKRIRIRAAEGTEDFNIAYTDAVAHLRGVPRDIKLKLPPVSNEIGFVYFLRSGERMKIGFSKNPFSRGQQLLTGIADGVHSFGFVPGSERDERAAHRALSKHRIAREWFECHPDVVKVMMRSLTFCKVAIEDDLREAK
ncbi:GIY-YIG nuclease family protein [Bradyrhizobium sp.]|uniref:GIY-YIG nuclease family protein n=1 Tax=Bradyrhizobium sp. TaxID=376 RepID=UPI0039E674DA